MSEGRRTALVTGANRGIGFEVARRLAEEGAEVIVTARNDDAAREAAERIGGSATALPVDVSSDESVAALADAVRSGPGRLDVLVNNAAGFVDWSEKASTSDLAGSRELFEVNLWGTWRVTQALLPLLRESPHPRIVNVSSGAGSHGDPGFGLTTNAGAVASYGISKAAVNALTAKLAAELDGTGVLVNAVCPGLTATAPGMEEMGARPPAESAAGVVWAAMLPDGGPTGGFFRDGESLPW